MTNSYKEKLTEATAQYQKLNKQYNQMAWYTNSSKPPLY